MQELTLTKQYPSDSFHLLGNTAIMTRIPDIMQPVVQVITISPNPADGEVYEQQKEKTDSHGRTHPTLYAITKNGLKKLADGAGITMVKTEAVLPSSCLKCVAASKAAGVAPKCSTCPSKDVAYKVTIAVPQLTGDTILVADTNEIIFSNLTFASASQKEQFTKFATQICEAKALNGAIRTALHLKGTYTREELLKPFVVAYLVPNLNNEDVKERAIENMFQSSDALYGSHPASESTKIEPKVQEPAQIEKADEEVVDQYIDAPDEPAQIPETHEAPAQRTAYRQPQQMQPAQPQYAPADGEEYQCSLCGRQISKSVYDFSVRRFGSPLCMGCQKAQGGGRT